MSWWQALILGIVEGVTEYLPVSSTGHLILASWALGLNADPVLKRATYTFNIVIQAGAIAAVLGLYWPRVVQMLRGVAGYDAAGRRLAGLLIVAFLPAAVLGPLLDDVIESRLNHPWPVLAALFAGAFLMLVTAKNRRLHAAGGDPAAGAALESIDVRMALLIGFGQCVAMCPGTSRSMMTIVTALLLGLAARDAAEFSFLLGLVTLSAATLFKGAKGGAEMLESITPLNLVVGFTAATVSAAFAVRWFVGALNRFGLAPFGWYRLVLAAILMALLWSGWLPESALTE